MNHEDLEYLFAERYAIMVENGATPLKARQQARKEIRERIMEHWDDVRFANMEVINIEKSVLGMDYG